MGDIMKQYGVTSFITNRVKTIWWDDPKLKN